jgi:sodium transport system permease protein
LVNIVLLGRDLLQGQMDPALFAGAVISTVLYALLALALAARVFGSDAILYGSQGSLKDLFRRPETVREAPTLTQVMFALAVLFPAFVILANLPGRLALESDSARLGVSALITVVLFSGWPALMAWRSNVRFPSAFRMSAASPGFFVVAVLWGGAVWVWVYELKILTTSAERLERLRGLFERLEMDLSQVPLPWLLVTLAVVPAVCEEWFFRGYLLSGLRERMSGLQAVLISALLFGLFHDIVKDLLLFDRFFTSGMMGLFLGWLAVRSGSLWPGMLLHVIHNGLLLTIASYQKELAAWGIGTSAEEHFPWPWLAGSAFAVLLGAVLVIKIRPKNGANSDDLSAAGR